MAFLFNFVFFNACQYIINKNTSKINAHLFKKEWELKIIIGINLMVMELNGQLMA